MYPPNREVFGPLWKKINEAAEKKVIISSKYVLLKIKNYGDFIARWAKRNKKIFKEPTPEQIAFVKQMQKKFPQLVAWTAPIIDADPFVIAIAKENDITVVSEEIEKPNAQKIPNVCRYFGIKHTNLVGMFNAEKW